MAAPLKILITGQKGGVGKSTISANLAAYFSHVSNKKTSLIDFDYQGCSSAWVNDAQDVGVDCKKISLPNAKGAGNVFLEAKEALRKISETSQIIICDFAWNDVLPPEFLFEFDIVLVPASLSKMEIKSTLDFVNRFSFIFNSRLRKAPKLAIVPSQVRNLISCDSLFSESFHAGFSLSRPVMFSASVDDFFGHQYFAINGNKAERENFISFGQSIEQLAEMEASQKQNSKEANFQHKVSGSVLDRFRAIRHSSQNPGKRLAANASVMPTEAAQQMQAPVPSFLALRSEA